MREVNTHYAVESETTEGRKSKVPHTYLESISDFLYNLDTRADANKFLRECKKELPENKYRVVKITVVRQLSKWQ